MNLINLRIDKPITDLNSNYNNRRFYDAAFQKIVPVDEKNLQQLFVNNINSHKMPLIIKFTKNFKRPTIILLTTYYIFQRPNFQKSMCV